MSAQEAPAHVAPPPRALPGGGQQQLHRLVAIVVDKPGVLNRVSSLMRARNFNMRMIFNNPICRSWEHIRSVNSFRRWPT